MKPQPKVYQMFRARKLLQVFLALFFLVLASVSCGGGTDSGTPNRPHSPTDMTGECYDASELAAQRAYRRDDYFPKRRIPDFSRDLGADISPENDDYDIATKVSRSVFELEFRRKGSGEMAGRGTGWLISPRYVATAAHNVASPIGTSLRCGKRDFTVHVQTFDGDTIDAEIVWFDEVCIIRGNDRALLRLEREINAVPMKIADQRPARNEMLMAMGGDGGARGLGAWTVTAGAALELRTENPDFAPPGRVYYWLPTGSGGMSGGPIFNRRGEVVTMVTQDADVPDGSRLDFGIGSPRKYTTPPENLWVYGFFQQEQPGITKASFGPNPEDLRELYNKAAGLSEPANAGDYGNNHEWERSPHPLGDHYSPFPIDQFDEMNRVYKEAREGAVTIKARLSSGSGFIYDGSTVITVAHVAGGLGRKAEIETIDGRRHQATVTKRQLDGRCDIAVMETDTRGALDGYKKLPVGDSSSLRCGDPLVQIGSGGAYNPAGPLQGLGAVYMRTGEYTSAFLSRSQTGGMSGGPVVDREGNVVAITEAGLTHIEPGEEWEKPGPLYIHTRLPVYRQQDESRGPNSETIRKFIEQSGFYCTP
ncbi:MAG: serine protease [Candidatus Dadabacteria bacterium]|nr:serine protease [Candidatus Dadabacteria bacterium]